MPEDETALVTELLQLRGLVSDETLLSRIPWIDDVDEELRKFIAGSTSSCYKIDKRFLSGIEIIFNENYSKNDETFANGYLSLPLSMFGFDTALAGVNEYNIKERISLLLKEYIDIRISAQCVFDDIASVNWNDIIFTSDTNIKVEIMPELKTY